MRPTSCEIDLDAIAKNVRTLAELAAPTPLCAVVKANGYGHGAVPVAKAAIAAGASWLAVALVEEGVELRQAGIDVPILVLSEPHADGMAAIVEHQLTPSVYTIGGIEALAREASSSPGPVPVHIGLDTGMRRVGAEPSTLEATVAEVRRHRSLQLDAIWTHCPVADEPDNPFTDEQLARFNSAVAPFEGVSQHVANSAAALTRPDRDAMMMRCGISIYGIDPDALLAGVVELHPAMTLRSEVSFVKQVEAGEGVGYGLSFVTTAPTTIATVPIGYADGVRRDLGHRGGEVLIGGKRHPIIGVVTMDQLMVDVRDAEVHPGDEAILVGSQGDETILAADVASQLGTIPYEIICAVSSRMPRNYSGGAA